MKWNLVILLLLLVACKENQSTVQVKEPEVGLIAQQAMVVSAREEASRIGSNIMQKGGNAFDAMVATEIALALTYPNAGNLGGGGFVVYRTQFGELGAFDYREKAPMKAYRNMYLDEEGNVIKDKSVIGGMAVAVPGTIAGIFAVHAKLGSLPMEELLEPVIELARKGYVVTEKEAAIWEKFGSIILIVNDEESIYTRNYKPGDTIRNLALANTLERISEEGEYDFYQGETARILIEFIKSKGGIISSEDLKAYEALLREPVVFEYKDLRLISMSPPSSGGIVLAQMMKSVEGYPLKKYGHNSVKAIQLLT
ncbi:MAG: gamma-glutamyltransferase, partial [Flavobacteriaceae bacterium]|nr:gamma-glutamyltransferase [Flavobacteriaceae bacterium]